jgi:hypothetical protein
LFENLPGFFRIDSDFVKRSTKMAEEGVKVSVIKTARPGARVDGMDVLSRKDDLGTEQHGNEHALLSLQAFYIGGVEEWSEVGIVQYSAVKRLRSRPDGAASTNAFVEFIDHVVVARLGIRSFD